jgi:small ligand-binding sensory domain FIST
MGGLGRATAARAMSSSPAAGGMRWAAAVSRLADSAAAAAEVADMLAARLDPGPVDLTLAFLSAHHVADAETLAGVLRERLAAGCLAGASARGVVASRHEIENEPALSVIAARLPGVTVAPFVISNEGWDEALADAAAFSRLTPGVREAELAFVLGDPFSLDLTTPFAAFERHAPGVRLVGGLASAAPRPGSNALFLNDWLAHEGGLAVALSGGLRADVVVSQGCRAIGPLLTVTRSLVNVIIELDGEPALQRTEQVLRELPEDEGERLRLGLYVGLPVRDDASGRGDYLIRPLLGADQGRGRLVVGDRVAEGQRVRLHVRDAQTAREDLELLLTPQAFDVPAQAALLFACNGRGRGLYGAPDGDIGPLQAALGGETPVAGMFCAGEIGPVGRRNYLHGHTASIAILRARP